MKNKDSKNKAESLSVDERNDVLSRSKSREIVQEIMNFGVSQSQIVYIIRMLSLELEDASLMNNINDLIVQSERFQTESEADLKEMRKQKIYT